MQKTVVLVGHSAGDTDDRVAAWALEQGYDIHWCMPCAGEEMPELTDEVAATVVYGGVYDVHQKSEHQFLRDELKWIESCLRNEVPTLGLCLGAQMMADVLGAPVTKHPDARVEYGYFELQPTLDAGDLFPEHFMVLEAHWEGWFNLPEGAVRLASTEHFPQQAFCYGERSYAFQFHPEATPDMLARWVARRNPERSSRVGGFSEARQLSDNKKYDAAMQTWLNRFLEGWLEPVSIAR